MLRQHAHLVEAGGEQRMDRLGAAGQGDVALAVLNRSHRGENFDQAAGAGRRVAQPRAEQADGDWPVAQQAVFGSHWSHHGIIGGGYRWPSRTCRRSRAMSPMWALMRTAKSSRADRVGVDPRIAQRLVGHAVAKRDDLQFVGGTEARYRPGRRSTIRRECRAIRSAAARRCGRRARRATRFRDRRRPRRSGRCR